MENKLKKCRNYNIITNCEFLDDDLFSKKLVDFYKKAVVNANDEVKMDKIVKYDRVMRKCIEDYNFSKKFPPSTVSFIFFSLFEKILVEMLGICDIMLVEKMRTNIR